MAGLLEGKKQSDAGVHKSSAPKNTTDHERAKSAPLKAPKLSEIRDADRKEILTLASKEIASSLGSHVLLRMLAESGVSMREIARRSGFDVSVLSNIAKGRRTSGPELWTLIALADAMDLDLELSFSKR